MARWWHSSSTPLVWIALNKRHLAARTHSKQFYYQQCIISIQPDPLQPAKNTATHHVVFLAPPAAIFFLTFSTGLHARTEAPYSLENNNKMDTLSFWEPYLLEDLSSRRTHSTPTHPAHTSQKALRSPSCASSSDASNTIVCRGLWNRLSRSCSAQGRAGSGGAGGGGGGASRGSE